MFHCMNQQCKAQKLWHVQYIITSRVFNSEMLSFDNFTQNTMYLKRANGWTHHTAQFFSLT